MTILRIGCHQRAVGLPFVVLGKASAPISHSAKPFLSIHALGCSLMRVNVNLSAYRGLSCHLASRYKAAVNACALETQILSLLSPNLRSFLLSANERD